VREQIIKKRLDCRRHMGPASPDNVLIAVDVGTSSVRAAAFYGNGARASATQVRPIRTRNARPAHFEQSTADIWRAVVDAIRAASQPDLRLTADQPRVVVRALGFAATCSLVAVQTDTGKPLSVVEHVPGNNPEEKEDFDHHDVFDTVLWLDHRSIEETDRINSRHQTTAVAAVRRHFGNKLSPENEPGKLAHLKAHMSSEAWASASFFDLADWLAFRCLGADIARSSCTTACKWGWGAGVGDTAGWSAAFWSDIGLGDLNDHQFRRIGSTVRPPGCRLGTLCPERAAELNIDPSAVVASPMIDAHCGALGMLNPAPCALLQQYAPSIHNRLAMICGTSTCHIALGPQGVPPIFVPGVWGPFRDAVLAGHYVTEGGQSTSGVLVDHIIDSHRAAPALRKQAEQKRLSLYTLLAEMTGGTGEVPDLADPACDLHIFPDFHGNRSPRADPTLRGGIVGLTLATSQEEAERELAVLFRSCIQALAYGTRHIIEEMNRAGHSLRCVIACGGLCKSDLFLRELADACGMPVFCPAEPDSVLLGGAILAATAASSAAESADGDSLATCMSRMSRLDEERVFLPRNERRHFHDRKYAVFQAMYDDQIKYKEMMRS
jgi:FGGY-family pentulose kinase